MGSKYRPIILLLILGLIWGTGYSIARFAITNGVPPLAYSFWQSLGPALLLLMFTKIKCINKDKQHAKINIQHSKINLIFYYVVCGLTGIVIPNTNMYFAASHLPAGLLAVIVNTVPIMAYPMALIAKEESFHWLRFMGVTIAFTGLMFIVLPHSSLPSLSMIPWVFQALLTPFCFAFCSVYIAKFEPQGSSTLQKACGTLFAASIILMPIVFIGHQIYLFHAPLNSADQVILLEIVLSTAGYILFFQLIKIAGPVYYSLVNTVVSLTGLFWGYVIFHETLNQWSTAAVFCILLALIAVNLRPQVGIPARVNI